MEEPAAGLEQLLALKALAWSRRLVLALADFVQKSNGIMLG